MKKIIIIVVVIIVAVIAFFIWKNYKKKKAESDALISKKSDVTSTGAYVTATSIDSLNSDRG